MSDKKVEALINFISKRLPANITCHALVENIINWVMTQSMDKENTINALLCMLDGIDINKKELEKMIELDVPCSGCSGCAYAPGNAEEAALAKQFPTMYCPDAYSERAMYCGNYCK